MTMTLEKRIFDLDHEIKALKSINAVSGSLIPMSMQKSEEYTYTLKTNGAPNFSHKFTFAPDTDINPDLNLLTSMTVTVNAKITSEDGSSYAVGPLYYKDTETRDEDGNLYIEATYDTSGSLPDTGEHTFEVSAHAIVTTLQAGTFKHEQGVI